MNTTIAKLALQALLNDPSAHAVVEVSGRRVEGAHHARVARALVGRW